MQLLCCWCSIF
jgi:hypothetical protein